MTRADSRSRQKAAKKNFPRQDPNQAPTNEDTSRVVFGDISCEKLIFFEGVFYRQPDEGEWCCLAWLRTTNLVSFFYRAAIEKKNLLQYFARGIKH